MSPVEYVARNALWQAGLRDRKGMELVVVCRGEGEHWGPGER